MRHHGVILLAVLCSLALSTAAFAGSVTGTIKYDGVVPKPGTGPFKAIAMDADPDCNAKHSEPVPRGILVLGDGNTLGNVFVQVKNAPAGGSAPSEAAVINQIGCVYEPHVLGLMAGQPLKFKNSDGLMHNVHGLPEENRQFNIGMPPTVKEREVTSLNKPEPLFKVKCDVHPWMNSYVAVMSHPYFAVTGEDGKFSIDDLPDGTYEIEAWHEVLKVRTQSVTVSGGAATVDFSFKPPAKK